MKRFQKGDRVFDIRYGWGTVTIFDGDHDVAIKFDSETNVRYFDGRGLETISFTEYTLNGYTAEKPKPSWGNIWEEYFRSPYGSVMEFFNENFEPPVRKCK